jgi:flavin reductase (DIM6/NTAB) family NADH-FMN oxidoreductase RutF
VTVVTCWDQDRPGGMTANSFSSVSLDPPLLLVSIDLRAASYDRIQRSGGFAVNILSEEQQHLAARFAGRHREMADPFADLTYRRAASGSPLLAGCLAWFDCHLEAVHPAGDHALFIGRILEADFDSRRSPLLFYASDFRELGRTIAHDVIWTW